MRIHWLRRDPDARAEKMEGVINCANTAGEASKVRRRTDSTVWCLGEKIHNIHRILKMIQEVLKNYLGHASR